MPVAMTGVAVVAATVLATVRTGTAFVAVGTLLAIIEVVDDGAAVGVVATVAIVGLLSKGVVEETSCLSLNASVGEFAEGSRRFLSRSFLLGLVLDFLLSEFNVSSISVSVLFLFLSGVVVLSLLALSFLALSFLAVSFVFVRSFVVSCAVSVILFLLREGFLGVGLLGAVKEVSTTDEDCFLKDVDDTEAVDLVESFDTAD